MYACVYVVLCRYAFLVFRYSSWFLFLPQFACFKRPIPHFLPFHPHPSSIQYFWHSFATSSFQPFNTNLTIKRQNRLNRSVLCNTNTHLSDSIPNIKILFKPFIVQASSYAWVKYISEYSTVLSVAWHDLHSIFNSIRPIKYKTNEYLRKNRKKTNNVIPS